MTSDLVLYAGWEKVAAEPAQEPEEPKKPESNTSQNKQNDDALAKTSDSSIILVPMGLAAAGIAAIAASRKR